MRPHGSAEQLAQRRRKAVALLEDGYSVKQVAQRVAATPKSVYEWWRQYQKGGDAALAAKSAPGRPTKLNTAQRRGLAKRLTKGARAEGYDTDLWTAPRVRELIRRHYGVTYHVDHIPKLLKELGFSPSEAPGPRRRA